MVTPLARDTDSEGGFFEDAMEDRIVSASRDKRSQSGNSCSEHLQELALDAELIDMPYGNTDSNMELSASSKSKRTSQRRRAPPKASTEASRSDTPAKQPHAPLPTTKGKGRPRKAPKKAPRQAAEEGNVCSEEPNQELPQSKEESLDRKRPMVLERNRVAATKCRVRKRSEASTLAASERELEDRNRELSATVQALEHQVYVLKTSLLQHQGCECVLIQKFIAHEAKKSLAKLMGETAPTPLRGITPVATPGGMTPGFGSLGGENSSILTPDLQGSSSTSTATESIQTQSPMTSLACEVLAAAPWVSGYPATSSSNMMATQPMDLYSQDPTTATMLSTTCQTENVLLSGFGNQQVTEPGETPYEQLPLDGNIGWDAGWQLQ